MFQQVLPLTMLGEKKKLIANPLFVFLRSKRFLVHTQFCNSLSTNSSNFNNLQLPFTAEFFSINSSFSA